MNTQIYHEASEWLIEFRTDETDQAARQKFETWLGKSPEHVRAYLELIAVWEDSSFLDGQRELDIEALIALSRTDANVFDLPSEGRAARAAATSAGSIVPRQKWRASAIAASALILLGSSCGFWYWIAYQRGSYTTDIGQQTTLALSDGTTVELNANTRIRERYTPGQRTVELIEGQALFRVARSSERPFVVISDTATVRAVGTQFDVYRRATGTTVTVIEGKVAVSSAIGGKEVPIPSPTDPPAHVPAIGSKPSVLLSAGQQVSIAGSRALRPTMANIPVATAWTQQKLIFESASLTEVAEEFNRFNSRKLVVDAEGLEGFRINGTFPALDPDSLSRFLVFLREQPGLVIEERGERVLVSKYR